MEVGELGVFLVYFHSGGQIRSFSFCVSVVGYKMQNWPFPELEVACHEKWPFLLFFQRIRLMQISIVLA